MFELLTFLAFIQNVNFIVRAMDITAYEFIIAFDAICIYQLPVSSP